MKKGDKLIAIDDVVINGIRHITRGDEYTVDSVTRNDELLIINDVGNPHIFDLKNVGDYFIHQLYTIIAPDVEEKTATPMMTSEQVWLSILNAAMTSPVSIENDKLTTIADKWLVAFKKRFKIDDSNEIKQ